MASQLQYKAQLHKISMPSISQYFDVRLLSLLWLSNILANVSLGAYCRLDGSVHRYRKMDMTIGEKDMMIAELEAQ